MKKQDILKEIREKKEQLRASRFRLTAEYQNKSHLRSKLRKEIASLIIKLKGLDNK